MISPSYLRTFGIPLIAGRSLEDRDNEAGEPVVLVSRTLARRFWDVGTAVGQTIAMALLLAAAGVYAVTAFSVTLRARELAIRAALGARRSQDLRSVVIDAVRPIGAGLVAGAAIALAAVPALGAVLFGVEALAAAPVVLVSATLLVVGLATALAAARPVRRIDPIDALKAE